jgi:hydroxymethylpyrimidine/phosphomethylpyrimidine kinase
LSAARVLIVAGSDSGGGAGIQADLKTVMALGGYAMTAVTAITAQNTQGVHGVFPVPPDFVQLQMRCVLADIGADAIKTGMLADGAMVDAVADIVAGHRDIPFVLDPVMVAKGGYPLLAQAAVNRVTGALLPLATIITPNLPEAETLCGFAVQTLDDQHKAADHLLRLGVQAVLLKGGHLRHADITDVLATADGREIFRAPRLDTRHTHGTGCTLASAIATGLAQGMSLFDAVGRAHRYVQAAIVQAPGLGRGHGPLDHAARF